MRGDANHTDGLFPADTRELPAEQQDDIYKARRRVAEDDTAFNVPVSS